MERGWPSTRSYAQAPADFVAAFLVEESLLRAVTRELQTAGHDVTDVRDVGLRGAPDENVFALACSEERILISGDVDFANTLRFPPGSHAGIVVLRLPNEWSPAARANRALLALADVIPELAQGALVIADPKRVRLLRAPTR